MNKNLLICLLIIVAIFVSGCNQEKVLEKNNELTGAVIEAKETPFEDIESKSLTTNKDTSNTLESQSESLETNQPSTNEDEISEGGSFGAGCGCINNNICDLNECATCPDCQEQSEEVYVTNVIDGDTIKLTNGETVRLIGINTAEIGEKCYQEAKNYLEQFLKDKHIRLEKDVDDRDQYGRLLRYIIANGANVNIQMVREGLANVYIVGSNTKYKLELEHVENIAKANNGCLWEESITSCKDCIQIANFHYNAEGNDCYNLNDEYVIFKNICSFSCDLSSWTVKDDTAKHLYTFPNFNLDSNAQVTLYSGYGQNSQTQLFWGGGGTSCPAIWNNNGDTLYLRDIDGNLVLSHRY